MLEKDRTSTVGVYGTVGMAKRDSEPQLNGDSPCTWCVLLAHLFPLRRGSTIVSMASSGRRLVVHRGVVMGRGGMGDPDVGTLIRTAREARNEIRTPASTDCKLDNSNNNNRTIAISSSVKTRCDLKNYVLVVAFRSSSPHIAETRAERLGMRSEKWTKVYGENGFQTCVWP
jgi:hypothetical protein